MTATNRPLTIDAALDVPPSMRQPMTRAQAKHLRKLCKGTGAEFEAGLTRHEAAHRIDLLEAADW